MSGGLEAFNNAAQENKRFLDSQPVRELICWYVYQTRSYIPNADIIAALARRGMDTHQFESRMRSIYDDMEDLVTWAVKDAEAAKESLQK